MTWQFITHGYIRLDQNMNTDSDPCVEKLTPDSSIGLNFLSRRIDFEAVMLLHSNLLCNVFLTFKISVIQVLLQLQKGSRNFIKILGISLADSNKTFPFKVCNRDHQRRRDKRNQNVDTWNPQYGLQLTKSRRKMLLLISHRYQLKKFLSKTFLHLWKRQ